MSRKDGRDSGGGEGGTGGGGGFGVEGGAAHTCAADRAPGDAGLPRLSSATHDATALISRA